MESVCAVDIGAGTQDVLLFEDGIELENCIKAVVPTRAVLLARTVERNTAAGSPVFLSGTNMGSGFLSSAVKRHIKAGFSVYSTPEAARTFRDNLDEVRARGIQIVDKPPFGMPELILSDVDFQPLIRLFQEYDRPAPSRFLIAVQDHGECLQGSNREIRFAYWREFLSRQEPLKTLLFQSVPEGFTRMKAVQARVGGSSLMDTGPAAILGCLYDRVVKEREEEGAVIVNVGNQHVLAALLKRGRVLGFMEHHTCFMDRERLGLLIDRFRKGLLTHQEIFQEKGHGCVILDEYREMEPFPFVAVTGPKRAMARNLGYHEAAPFGDMMLTGCFGLLGAAGMLNGTL